MSVVTPLSWLFIGWSYWITLFVFSLALILVFLIGCHVYWFHSSGALFIVKVTLPIIFFILFGLELWHYTVLLLRYGLVVVEVVEVVEVVKVVSLGGGILVVVVALVEVGIGGWLVAAVSLGSVIVLSVSGGLFPSDKPTPEGENPDLFLAGMCSVSFF